MRAKNLALRVLSTAAMLSIVTSIAAPAFAATYYINDGSVDVAVSKDGIVTVEQGGVTYTDTLDGVVIRGGTRSEGDKGDDRVKADASPATQEADGSNAPAGNETEAPKSENTAGDAAPKPETTAAGERKEGTPQQEPTEEEAKEKVTPEQKPTEKEAEEKVTPELVKAKAEATKATQKPSAEQEEEQQEEQQEKEDEPTVPSAAPLTATPAAQADNSSTSTPAAPINNVITIVNNFVNDAKQAFSFVLDNVNIDRYYTATHDISAAALTVKGDGDTEIELDGDNILKGSYSHAGLEKTDHDGKGSLTIKDDNEKAGSLTAVGGEDGAAIGGSFKWDDPTVADTRNIKITGGTINAFGGDDAAGIGAGKYGYADNIEITGDAVVIAHGRQRGAAIGGGYGTGADITISGNATVEADAYNGAPAIGSGGNYKADGERANTTIRIKDQAKVTAIGSYGSAAIGTGYTFDHKNTGKTTIEISGGTITAVAGSNSAAIGRGNNNSANVSVTVTGDTGNTTIDAACKLDQECAIGGGKDNGDAIDSASSFGEKNGVVVRFYKNSPNAIDYLKDLKDQVLGQQYKLLHNAQWWMNNGFTSEPSTDTNHAWKVDDTKERVEPTPDQVGHVYYKCSVPGCKAVHDEVLPKLEPESTPDPTPVQPDPTPVQPEPAPEPTPDPTPVQPEPTPEPTPDPTPVQPEPAPVQPDTPADTQNTAKDDVSTPKLYVIDLANTQVLFDETRQNDTVTYTTKQDGASLTGSFEALEAMAADGVKTIVFQTIGTNTPGAVSRVSVDALLQHGGETLLLTHNGTEVHLTIDGQNADSLLLQ